MNFPFKSETLWFQSIPITCSFVFNPLLWWLFLPSSFICTPLVIACKVNLILVVSSTIPTILATVTTLDSDDPSPALELVSGFLIFSKFGIIANVNQSNSLIASFCVDLTPFSTPRPVFIPVSYWKNSLIPSTASGEITLGFISWYVSGCSNFCSASERSSLVLPLLKSYSFNKLLMIETCEIKFL